MRLPSSEMPLAGVALADVCLQMSDINHVGSRQGLVMHMLAASRAAVALGMPGHAVSFIVLRLPAQSARGCSHSAFCTSKAPVSAGEIRSVCV